MLKNKFLTTTVWILISFLSTAEIKAQSSEVLKICAEGDYFPFSMTNSDGSLSGFDIDLAKAICGRLDKECVVLKTGWEAMIPSLLNRRCDAIVASMSITEERKKHVDFSDPYYKTSSLLVGKKVNFPLLLKDEMQLNSKKIKIGVQGGSVQQSYVEQYLPKAKIKLYQTQHDMERDLKIGRIDLIFTELIQARAGIMKDPEGKAEFTFVGKKHRSSEYLGTGQGIAVRKESRKLLDEINRVIQEIKHDGTFKDINYRYFDFDINE